MACASMLKNHGVVTLSGGDGWATEWGSDFTYLPEKDSPVGKEARIIDCCSEPFYEAGD